MRVWVVVYHVSTRAPFQSIGRVFADLDGAKRYVNRIGLTCQIKEIQL